MAFNFLSNKRCKLENLENGCANIFDLSLKNFSQFKELKGFLNLTIKDFFSQR